ncbi:hypothetical protein C0J52_16088, partial [Blattella germanica]
VGDILIRPTTPRLLSIGSLEAKCSNEIEFSASRPATSSDANGTSKEDDDTQHECSKDGDTLLFLESMDKEDNNENNEEGEVVNEESMQEADTQAVPDAPTPLPSTLTEDR